MPVTRSEKRQNNAIDPKNGMEHLDTPKKIKLRQIVAIFEQTGPTPWYRSKADIFRQFNISRRNGYRVIYSPSDRTRPVEEKRGRYPIITADLL